MNADALMIPGGIGLFLLGMTALSEGLRALAGEGLRMALARFTSTPARGAVAGALATAAIQSSSATTLMTVGFVGAGLMSFPQAVGVILGANVGTTMTGWMVALVGFKLDLGLAGLPLLFVAMLARMFGRGRLRDGAWALAGFCLIFIGIDALKDGMAAFGDVVTPDSLPSGGWLARLQLVGLGIVVTVVTQSSSAGVATALAALGAGAIDFPQAAAMVIGMDVGTTFTAALAAAGGSSAMRRTALAHVLYNLLTGATAFLLLGPLSALAAAATPDPQLGLVAFHTSFNALGVACVLPLAHRFARLVERLAPEQGPALGRRLDARLTADPDAAADAAAATVREIDAALRAGLERALAQARHGRTPPPPADLEAARQAVAATHRFLGASTPVAATPAAQARLEACLHALDHLDRLARRAGQTERLAALARDARLRRLGGVMAAALAETDPGRLSRLAGVIGRREAPFRRRALREAAAGRLGAAEAERRLAAMRWMQRTANHLDRIAVRLGEAEGPLGQPG